VLIKFFLELFVLSVYEYFALLIPVLPYWAKFRRFGKISKASGYFLPIFFSIWQNIKPTLAIFMLLGKFNTCQWLFPSAGDRTLVTLIVNVLKQGLRLLGQTVIIICYVMFTLYLIS